MSFLLLAMTYVYARFLLEVFLCILGFEGTTFNLYDNSTNSDGLFCPGDIITFTCVGTGVPVVLEWFRNGSIVAEYRYRSSHTFPRDADMITDPSNVTIRDVISLSATAINITSTLTGSFNNLNGFLIECGSDTIRSNSTMVSDFGKLLFLKIGNVSKCTLHLKICW